MKTLRCGLPMVLGALPFRTLLKPGCCGRPGQLALACDASESRGAVQAAAATCWQHQSAPPRQRQLSAAYCSKAAATLRSRGSQCSSQRRLLNITEGSRKQDPELVGPPTPSSSSAYGMLLPAGGRRMILTDAMSLLYRSHYAFSDAHRLRNAAGEDTTVLFGFLNMLLSLLELSPPPTHFAVVLDARGKTFRHEIYEGYKGQRQACPDAVKAAVPRLQALLKAMAIPVIQVPGVEADDVIGTMALRAVEEGMAVAIASPDKDFLQLLRPASSCCGPPKKPAPGERVNKYALVPYSEADFEAEYGLRPQQFVDVLALAGDASDNVPGVAGIGPKTAVSLLKQFGSLDEVLEHAGEAKSKKAAAQLSSVEGQSAARLSRQLVRIETALDLPPVREPLDALRLVLPPDRGADLLHQFQELQFHRHTTRVQQLWASELYR